MDSRTLLNEALSLRPAERLLLIDMIAKSLNTPDEGIEELWIQESEKRLVALKKGNVKTITLSEIKKRYK